jgi:phosphatidylinositol-3-phosphatase
VTSKGDHDWHGPDRGKRCRECGSARAADQRYCLACGARFGPVPAPIAALFGTRSRAEQAKAGSRDPKAEAAEPAPEKGAAGWPHQRSSFMPSPRAAAAAVIGMLALGVAIGSATDQIAQSAGLSTILLESPPPEEEAAPEPVAAEPEAEAVEAEAAPPPVPLSIPNGEAVVEEPQTEEPPPEVPEIDEELPTGMPEVKHVFLVMLDEGGYEETFGKSATSPFLRKTLPTLGEVLPNYFAVTSGALANRVALLSGQGPTPETAAGCPNYADLAPGTESAAGQVEGNGCVYPGTTGSLPRQLTEKKLKWRAYVEGMDGAAAAGQPTACRHPQPGTPDPNQAATETDPYVTSRNPFVYFHSVIDSPDCAQDDVALPQLSTDLRLKAEKFPNLAYVASGEESLKATVAEIRNSAAYKEGGLIVITSAQAPQEGENADSRSCCLSPDYPNLPATSEEPTTGPVKETGGGGQVGAVLISPFIEPGTTSETYFNHYSLLATIEELLGLEKIGYAAEPAITGFDGIDLQRLQLDGSQSSRISSAVSRPRPMPLIVSACSARGFPSWKRPSRSARCIAARLAVP